MMGKPIPVSESEMFQRMIRESEEDMLVFVDDPELAIAVDEAMNDLGEGVSTVAEQLLALLGRNNDANVRIAIMRRSMDLAQHISARVIAGTHSRATVTAVIVDPEAIQKDAALRALLEDALVNAEINPHEAAHKVLAILGRYNDASTRVAILAHAMAGVMVAAMRFTADNPEVQHLV